MTKFSIKQAAGQDSATITVFVVHFARKWRASCKSGSMLTAHISPVKEVVNACIAVQMFNILNWLLPNAYILVKYPGCSFFDDLIQVCGCLRWTCWNSSLLIYLVLGSSLLAWTPGSGEPCSNMRGLPACQNDLCVRPFCLI